MSDKQKENKQENQTVHGQKYDPKRQYSSNHYYSQNPKAAERAARRAENFYSF